jgi:hypothetical protein
VQTVGGGSDALLGGHGGDASVTSTERTSQRVLST